MSAHKPRASGPADWRKYYDEEHGMPYYHSESRRLTTWTLPAGCTASEVASSPRQGPRPSTSKQVVERRGNWCQVADTVTGEVYFVHRRTKATRWQAPVHWETPTPESPPSEELAPASTIEDYTFDDVEEVKHEAVEPSAMLAQSVSSVPFPAVSELPPPPESVIGTSV